MARAHALPQFIIRATVFDMATNFSATFWLYAKGWLSFFAPLRTIGSTYKPLPTSAHPCHCAIANPLPAVAHPIASQCPPHCQSVSTPLPASVHPCHYAIANPLPASAHPIASHCQPVPTPLPASVHPIASHCQPVSTPLPASVHPIANQCQPVPTHAIAPLPTIASHCQPVRWSQTMRIGREQYNGQWPTSDSKTVPYFAPRSWERKTTRLSSPRCVATQKSDQPS